MLLVKAELSLRSVFGQATFALALAVIPLAHAHAQDLSDTALEISGDLPGCVSRSGLRARIRELMAGQPWPGELSVDLQLGAAAPHFSVSKRGQAFAERRFEPMVASCAERRDAIAVAIVMAVENYLAEQELAGAKQESAVAASLAAPVVNSAEADSGAREPEVPERRQDHANASALPSGSGEAPRDAAPAREARGLQLSAAGPASLYAGGQWLWAVAPGAASALAAGVELNLGDVWSLDLGGLWAPPAEHVLAAGLKRVVAQLFAGQGLGCWNARGHALILQGCAGAAAGTLDAQGRGFEHPQRAALAWGAVLLRAAAQWPAQSAIALRARADARVNVLRPEPEVPGPQGFRAPVGIFGADLGIDLLWRLR